MHFVANNLNTYISSPKVNEVGKYIKYFRVCILLRASRNWKIWNGKSVFLIAQRIETSETHFCWGSSSEIADKVFKFSYSDATGIWPNLCALKDAFNTKEDTLAGTILNFRNVKVVLGKENVTIRAEKPKFKAWSTEMELYYIQLLFIFRLRLRFIESNQVYLYCVLIGT